MPNTAMGPMQIKLLDWLQIHQAKKCPGYTLAHLMYVDFDELGMEYRQIESAISRLKKRGLVEEVGTSRTRKIWRLTDAGRKYEL